MKTHSNLSNGEFYNLFGFLCPDRVWELLDAEEECKELQEQHEKNSNLKENTYDTIRSIQEDFNERIDRLLNNLNY